MNTPHWDQNSNLKILEKNAPFKATKYLVALTEPKIELVLLGQLTCECSYY